MESIGIEDVLTRFSDTYDRENNGVKTFGIKFLTKEDGARQLQVRKYTRGPRQSVSGSAERGKASHNLQMNGNIMCHDVQNDRIIEVKAAMIFGFQDYQSTNWLNVFH
jgi:hypothetical protein